VSISPKSPFPDFVRPTAEECRAARDALALLHGEPRQHKPIDAGTAAAAADSLHTHSQQTVLDSLVRTILSQNTTDVTSHRAFASLKAAFPGEEGWEDVLRAPPGKMEEAIRMGGLADIKAERIKAILATLLEERGKICMEYLREMSDDEIKAELFKGVGKKTVACVLMFCLAREEFPVDTHVWRISKSLGWVPAKATRDAAYEHLNLHVPADVRYDLHVLMVEHGKRCPRCASNGKPRKESHGDCPLRNLKELALRS
ncbi:DNA glycosylase, partial [Coccomyxa subellipsoidea C-169]